MIAEALDELLKILPGTVLGFESDEFPLPVKTAILGRRDISVPEVRKALQDRQGGDVKDLLEPLLLASELIEAAMPDKERFFIKDNCSMICQWRDSKRSSARRGANSYIFIGRAFSGTWRRRPVIASRL